MEATFETLETPLILLVEVFAVITISANGAKNVAQTIKIKNNETAPAIIKIFFLNFEKSGTFIFFLALLVFAFFKSGLTLLKFLLSSISKFSRSSASFSSGLGPLNSEIGRLSPSITSSPSTSRISISGISGLLCNVFATGIFAAADIVFKAELFVTKTIFLSAFWAVRDNNLIFTALRKTPKLFGGTIAIIRSFEDFILFTTSVISSSTST